MTYLKRTFFLFTAAVTLFLSACAPKQNSGPTSETINTYTQQLAGLDADETLFTINGEDVPAEFYLYWLTYNCSYWEYMNLMYSDAELDFSSDAGDGKTTAEFLKEDAQKLSSYYILLEQQAQANDCGLTEEQLAEWEQTKTDYISENGQEAFNQMLNQLGISLATFDRISTSSYLYQNLMASLVAEPTTADMDEFTAANDVYKAKHILISTAEEQEDGTILLSTGNAPTNEDGTPFTGTAEEYNTKAKAKAEDILSQLAASSDPIATFDELMFAHSEDSGLTSNPDGYTFASTDSFVDEFKDAVYALDYGEYSSLVKSSFGYHIILRVGIEDEYKTGKMDEMNTKWLEESEIITTQAFDSIDVATVYANYKAHQEELSGTDGEEDTSAETSPAPSTSDPSTSPSLDVSPSPSSEE